MDFDSFLEMYDEWQSNPHIYMVNRIQMQYLKAAYDNLEHLIHRHSADVKIEVKMNEFNDGAASITAETDEIVVKEIKSFIAVIEHASNFEVYPLLNGNMRIAITFNDLMTFIQ